MAQARGPSLKRSLISPPVRKEMDAQDATNPKPIPVIIVLAESKESPESGIELSKRLVKNFLREKSYSTKESDFYLFASLRPADIEDLSDHREWIHRIWKDETTYSHLLASTESI